MSAATGSPAPRAIPAVVEPLRTSATGAAPVEELGAASVGDSLATLLPPCLPCEASSCPPAPCCSGKGDPLNSDDAEADSGHQGPHCAPPAALPLRQPIGREMRCGLLLPWLSVPWRLWGHVGVGDAAATDDPDSSSLTPRGEAAPPAPPELRGAYLVDSSGALWELIRDGSTSGTRYDWSAEELRARQYDVACRGESLMSWLRPLTAVASAGFGAYTGSAALRRAGIGKALCFVEARQDDQCEPPPVELALFRRVQGSPPARTCATAGTAAKLLPLSAIAVLPDDVPSLSIRPGPCQESGAVCAPSAPAPPPLALALEETAAFAASGRVGAPPGQPASVAERLSEAVLSLSRAAAAGPALAAWQGPGGHLGQALVNLTQHFAAPASSEPEVAAAAAGATAVPSASHRQPAPERVQDMEPPPSSQVARAVAKEFAVFLHEGLAEQRAEALQAAAESLFTQAKWCARQSEERLREAAQQAAAAAENAARTLCQVQKAICSADVEKEALAQRASLAEADLAAALKIKDELRQSLLKAQEEIGAHKQRVQSLNETVESMVNAYKMSLEQAALEAEAAKARILEAECVAACKDEKIGELEFKIREMGVTASLYMAMLKEAEAAAKEARSEADLASQKLVELEKAAQNAQSLAEETAKRHATEEQAAARAIELRLLRLSQCLQEVEEELGGLRAQLQLEERRRMLAELRLENCCCALAKEANGTRSGGEVSVELKHALWKSPHLTAVTVDKAKEVAAAQGDHDLPKLLNFEVVAEERAEMEGVNGDAQGLESSHGMEVVDHCSYLDTKLANVRAVSSLSQAVPLGLEGETDEDRSFTGVWLKL
eukprot:SM000016S01847  [mRNA]  locus=s16:260793:263786:+ [translate_table: standard]